MQEKEVAYTSGKGMLVRLYWVFIGNAVLLFFFMFILQKRLSFPSLLDLCYWLVAASLVLVRYIDIRHLKGETDEGQPATMNDWRRYSMLVGSIALVAWILAHGFIHIATKGLG